MLHGVKRSTLLHIPLAACDRARGCPGALPAVTQTLHHLCDLPCRTAASGSRRTCPHSWLHESQLLQKQVHLCLLTCGAQPRWLLPSCRQTAPAPLHDQMAAFWTGLASIQPRLLPAEMSSGGCMRRWLGHRPVGRTMQPRSSRISSACPPLCRICSATDIAKQQVAKRAAADGPAASSTMASAEPPCCAR